MYNEWPFLERFKACAEDGFEWAECLFPYDVPPDHLAAVVAESGVKLLQINAPAGDWAKGDRGLAVDPARESEFKLSIELALKYAEHLKINQMHVLAGVGADWNQYRKNLSWLSEQTQGMAMTWLIEPINRRDVPGYLLAYQADAHRLIQELSLNNVKVQMDLYHCQIMEGDIISRLRQYLPGGNVAHIQIAGVPERHEPSRSELSYSRVFEELIALDYRGLIGCEYRPLSGTRAGLDWIKSV
ncbi:MAG: TIM barrel protein [Limnobacter sp.]|nr:TIM barrel protein [Limnobacter sp.]